MSAHALAPPLAATRRLRIVAWALAVAGLAMLLGGWIAVMGGNPSTLAAPRPHALAVVLMPVAAAFPVVGLLIAIHQPRNPIGWLLLGFAVCIGLETVLALYADHRFAHGQPALPADRWAAWVASWIGALGLPVVIVYLCLLYPSGRLPSARWRPFAIGAGILLALVTVAQMLAARPISPYRLENPAGVPGAAPVSDALGLVFLIVVVVAVAALVRRYRASSGEERLQIRWLAYAGATCAALFLVGALVEFVLVGPGPFADTFWTLGIAAFVLIPIATGLAILRYRLYDIQLLANRALVYAALTALVVGGYVGVVVLLGALFSQQAGVLVSLVATATIAVLFAPVRLRLQRAANRLLYGDRDNPFGAVARLGRRLDLAASPDSLLDGVPETLASSLRLPYAAIELLDDGRFELASTYGRPAGELVRLPLVHHGEELGRLVVSTRAPGEALSAADRRVLDQLALQAGAAAHAVLLGADLQRSRERIVAAREEERRRLRYALHDGVGPTLAGIALEIESARSLLHRDPDAALATIADLRTEARGAIAEVRRLAVALRPPALDELGLLKAIQALAAGARPLELRLSSDGDVRELPAAVEVAAYRIAQDGIATAAAHPGARTCVVRVRRDAGLAVDVVWDGEPQPLAASLVHALRERAAELGGSCNTERRATGGVRVEARLPIRGRQARTA
jgi:signal transduction histidine kinase